MKYYITGLFLLLFFSLNAQTIEQIESKRIQLPNGWNLSPVGRSLQLGDLPLNIAVSKNKKLIAVTNNGQSTQSIQLIDAINEKMLDEVVIAKSWYGLKFSKDDKLLYAAAGNDNSIKIYSTDNNKLQLKDSIILGKKWPEKISPTGIEIDESHQLLYVVTKENNTIYKIDLKTKTIVHTIALGAEAYTCLLSVDKKTLFISLWGGNKILYYNTEKDTIVKEIVVGDHPNEICLSSNGKYLYAANANNNSVSVIDVLLQKVMETLNAALFPNAPIGTTSNGVALSGDDKTLYIANADNNCLSVFDVSNPAHSISKGFIPVGWYPTNVKVLGKKIFVSNGKGFCSLANPNGPNPMIAKQKVTYQQSDNQKPKEVQYIAGLFKGTLSIIDMPTDKQLSIYSQVVYHNTPYTKYIELNAAGESGNPIPQKVGAISPIKYVFYVIKENRTYDQVLGDVEKGNGDKNLVLFGNKITPNQHALANDFVLLDNFYVDAEVSADGHNWSMGAYANDYLEKTWPTSYGGRGGGYEAEGFRNIASNKSFIWNFCAQNKVSYRSYGEFINNINNKPNIPILKDHYCNYFTGWDMAVRDTTRFSQWNQDFDSLLANNALTQFNTIRLGNDHTEGLRMGKSTPFANVADNDLAVGLLIDYISHSAIWKESVIFILEDDAQNGPDHVDAHRSTAYVAGPFVKRNFVDHTMYSTSGMLRTIELILGMPPMTQYDAAATPMWNSFTAKPDYKVFNHLAEQIDLNEKNVQQNAMTELSEKYDFTKEDKVPDLILNQILWKGIKGMDATTPTPYRAAFVKLNKKGTKDDD